MAAKISRYQFSNYVYTVIDQAGINQDIKNIRVRYQNDHERIITNFTKCFKGSTDCVILTGSTSEGVIPPLISDTDCMSVYNDIICVDDPNGNTNSTVNILKPDYKEVPPGYVKVVPVQLNVDNVSDICTASRLCSKSYLYKSSTGEPYISSAIFNNFHKQAVDIGRFLLTYDNIRTSQLEYNGPAVTFTGYADLTSCGLNESSLQGDVDNVFTIYFYNSSILTEWATRTRFYDWPSRELIKEVSVMEGFLLPIGEKESENQNLEWRISYVTAEKKMLSNFNSTHDKLYVILKVFSKQVFTSVSKSFTSYMVKNVILWMAEHNPSGRFTPKLFIDRLLHCLYFIKHCLQNNHLPNYILPERNMLAGRLYGQEKQELINLLSELIIEEENIVYRLPKLSMYLQHVSIKPELFACYGLWRNYVETLFLIELYRMSANMKPEMSLNSTFVADIIWRYMQDPRCLNIRLDLLKVLVPGYVEKMCQGQFKEIDALFQKNLKTVLRCCFLQ